MTMKNGTGTDAVGEKAFAPRRFDARLDPGRLSDLKHKVDVLLEDKRHRPPTSPFEADKERFGLTHDEYIELLHSWSRFLTYEGVSEPHQGSRSRRGRPHTSGPRPASRVGADHDSWAAQEARLASFEHYLVDIEDVTMHFIHERPDYDEAERSGRPVIPLILLHGWPGSFLEFLDVAKPLAHPGPSAPPHVPAFDVVIPSHAGYAFSSGPTRFTREPGPGGVRIGIHSGPQGDFIIADEARLCDKLMVGLGFGSGYAIQAGDWSSATLRSMCNQFPSRAVAAHLNFCPCQPPRLDPPLLKLVPSSLRQRLIKLAPACLKTTWDKLTSLSRSFDVPFYASASYGRGLIGAPLHLLARLTLGAPSRLTVTERRRTARRLEFQATGQAYAAFHGTRPSTLGLVLESSPGALLAWVAEKFLAWTDARPTDAEILSSLTLWWCTDTASRALYPYRNRPAKGLVETTGALDAFISQPTGYSDFPMEIMPCPREWVASTVNLRWYRSHEEGGHFAAMERPADMVEDIRDCFAELWPQAAKA